MFRRDFVAAVALVFTSSFASAQFIIHTPSQVCATQLQSSMACVLPQTYGPNGLTLPNPNHEAHFAADSAQFAKSISSSLGTELSLLALPSPASGLIFTTDPTLGTVTPTSESYGPILSERAETIGRHRFYVAGTFQYFNFSSLDGISLSHLPVTFSHIEFPGIGGVPAPYEQEYITTINRIDVKARQTTLYATYGLTNRIDVSVAVPILDVSLGISSAAHIVRMVPQPVPTTDPYYNQSVMGYFHYFNAADPAGSLNQTFSSSSRATGVGDILFRVKGTVVKAERVRVAVGADVRTPSGDAKNFLGSGAPGLKGFVVASYRARFSPHVNIGYEYNGQSLLAGSVTNDTTGKLPNQFFYSGGVDIGLTKRWTIAADLLGTRLSSTLRIQRTGYSDVITGAFQPGVQQIATYRDSLNMEDVAVGTKFSPFGNFLITANVVFQANDPGLRASVVPLVGVSYSF